MYAIIETGGKQYKVSEGDIIYIEKLETGENEGVKFDRVLLCGESGKMSIGAPYVEGAHVDAKVVKNGKSRKIIIFKYNAKKNYRKRQGHRQPYTKVQIEKIALS